MATFAPCWDDKSKPAPTSRSGIPTALATALAPQISQASVKPPGDSPGMEFVEHPGRRYRPKWPSAPPELECATVESSTSAGSDTISKLVRKLSRSCSSRASSILKRASWRPDKRMSWYQESLDGNADSLSRNSSVSEMCENMPTGDLDPLLGSRRLRSSVRFSSESLGQPRFKGRTDTAAKACHPDAGRYVRGAWATCSKAAEASCPRAVSGIRLIRCLTGKVSPRPAISNYPPPSRRASMFSSTCNRAPQVTIASKPR